MEQSTIVTYVSSYSRCYHQCVEISVDWSGQMVGSALSSCWENSRTIFTRRHLNGMQNARLYHHICIEILTFYQRLRIYPVLKFSHIFSSVKAAYLNTLQYFNFSLNLKRSDIPQHIHAFLTYRMSLTFTASEIPSWWANLVWAISFLLWAKHMHYKNKPKEKIHTDFHWCSNGLTNSRLRNQRFPSFWFVWHWNKARIALVFQMWIKNNQTLIR